MKGLISIVGVVCLSSVIAEGAVAADGDWIKGACSRQISGYLDDRPSQVLRMRLDEDRDNTDDLAFELGTPRDGRPTEDSWRLYVKPSSDVERAEFMVGIQRDGWVVFRKGDDGRIEHNAFYPWNGTCVSLSPPSADADLPDGVEESLLAGRGGTASSAREKPYMIPVQHEFDRDTDRDEQVKALFRSVPKQVVAATMELDKACKGDGASNSTVDRRYITALDIDADNDSDWVLNDAHFYCLYPDGAMKSVGEQDSANITVFSNTTRGASQSLSLYTTRGEIRQFDGFAVYIGYGTGGTDLEPRYVRIRKGQATEIEQPPAGGKTVYWIGNETVVHGAVADPMEDFEVPDEPRIAGFMRDEEPVGDQPPQVEVPDLGNLQAAYPVPLLAKLADQHEACLSRGGTSLDLTPAFLVRIDFDGDGDLDYIADQKGLACNMADGSIQSPGGADRLVWLLAETKQGAVMSAEARLRGKVRRHRNFASVEAVDGSGIVANLQIRNGKASPLRKVPAGGTVVFGDAE